MALSLKQVCSTISITNLCVTVWNPILTLHDRILRALRRHPIWCEVVVVGIYIFKLMKLKAAILILGLIIPASVIIRFHHVIFILGNFRESQGDRLAAIFEASYFILGGNVLRLILFDLAMHLFVSFHARSTNITATDKHAD